MVLAAWNPDTVVSRGNVAVTITPAIADINNPTVAELSEGLGLTCSITNFNASSEVNSETVDWLCRPVSESIPGATQHSIDDLMLKVSGQNDQDLYTALSVGDIVYFWRRDGIPVDDPVAAGQYVWVWKAKVTGVDPAEGSNTYVAINCHITVLDRCQRPVVVQTGGGQ